MTHIVVDKQHSFEMSPMNLFNLMNLAAEAESELQTQEGLIPHEVIEEIAKKFIEQEIWTTCIVNPLD